MLISMFGIRWAFIDLSAGPFSWGPAVGGEGVRTELSLPNVEKTIGAVSGTAMSSIHYLLDLFGDHFMAMHAISYSRWYYLLWVLKIL